MAVMARCFGRVMVGVLLAVPALTFVAPIARAEEPAAGSDAATADISDALKPAKKGKWDPKGKAIDPFGRGDAKRKQEAWGEAIPLLVESIDAQPGCGKCLSSLALALSGAERYDDAVKVAMVIVNLYPDRKEGWQRVSDVWDKAPQKSRECVDATTKYLEIEAAKSDSDMWWRRNRHLLQLAEIDEANKLLDGAEAAGLKKEDVSCLRIQLLAASDDPVGARDLWSACDQSENVDLKRYSEGWLALSEGETELAAKRLMMAGADNFARLTIAFLRIDESKYDMALNLTTKLLEDEEWADARLAKAQALHGLGKDDESLAELDAHLMGDGWVAKHQALSSDQVLLKPKGSEWPKSVGRQAATLEIQLLSAKGDAAKAKAVYDDAVKLYGEADLKAVEPAMPAPEPAAAAPGPAPKR